MTGHYVYCFLVRQINGGTLMARQVNPEGCTFARLTVRMNKPLVLFDDAIDR
ncbi:hypothetical protein [Desulfobacter vibrioformis]|uniref:hypothetical protein n=1 Tax=Desulfobacter vibrioformis TaxID=34031 RepID=UPI001FE1053F|nr:hypothetical protein [Desulfobacter vibrioformis]